MATIAPRMSSYLIIGAWATKHMAEYFVYVAPNQSKDGKTTLAGEEFLDEKTKDFMDKAQRTGHKIRMTVKENSLGPANRTAEFTLSYTHCIVKQY